MSEKKPKQKVSISVTRLVALMMLLALLSSINLVVSLLQGGDLGDIERGTNEISVQVTPLCLTAGAIAACEKQIEAATQPAVKRLCRIVLGELGLSDRFCDRPEFDGNPRDSAAERKQQRQSDTVVQGGEGAETTAPPPSGEPGAGVDPTPTPETPGVVNPEPEQPVVVPPDEEPEPDRDNGTCVAAVCVNVPGELDEGLPDNIPGDLIPAIRPL